MLLLLLGLLYLVWLRLTGLAVPCAFHSVTGLRCPGCGITRMLLALSRFHFREAFQANPFLLATSPLLLFLILFNGRQRRRREPLPRWSRRLLWGYLTALLLFGIVRNLYFVL
ncbi:MAG: DUF2752 domain-containing protein [Oribacterium sp.]